MTMSRNANTEVQMRRGTMHLIERLCLKAYIVGVALSREIGLLEKYGDISGALPADEFREIVEELKEYVRSLPGGH